MKVKAVKTRVLLPPQDDLLYVIEKSIQSLEEYSIVAITSKVVSIWENRCVPISSVVDKDELIIKQADKYLPRSESPHGWVMHTIKNNLFIPSAGIDESNGNNHFILWPQDPQSSADNLLQWLKKQYQVKNIGIIITDSHTIPLRRGTLGISLAHAGFKPIKDYRDKADLFNRKMKITTMDIADSLAVSAVLCMGEGNESTPIAIISEIPFVEFGDYKYLENDPNQSFEIPEQEDLYYPLLNRVTWKKVE
jgi:dihydrofolate synthase / folylpolyglutamate synthase